VKPGLITALACGLLGCAHTGWRENQAFALRDSDWGMIAGNALTLIERYGPVSHFVVVDGLDRNAVAALNRFRPLIPPADVRRDGRTVLPAGYFLVESFTIDTDGSATFEGDLGPTGCPTGCGRNLSIPYVLRGDDWYNPSVKVTDYSIRREVVPVQHPD
jgi:hypothetical protein